MPINPNPGPVLVSSFPYKLVGDNGQLMDWCRQIENTFQQLKDHEASEAERQLKWDRRFLELARHVSTWSKDPSTKCGAVIVDERRAIVGIGYNGFAPGVRDDPALYADRDTKLAMVVHCEENAVVLGDRDRLRGATLYTWPFMSCSKCAGLMVAAGIARCVAPPTPADKQERYKRSHELAMMQFHDAGIPVDLVELPDPTDELAKTYEAAGLKVFGSGPNLVAVSGGFGGMEFAINCDFESATQELGARPTRVFRFDKKFGANYI